MEKSAIFKKLDSIFETDLSALPKNELAILPTELFLYKQDLDKYLNNEEYKEMAKEYKDNTNKLIDALLLYNLQDLSRRLAITMSNNNNNNADNDTWL